MLQTKEGEVFSLNDIHTYLRRTLLSKYDMSALTAEFRALPSNYERVFFTYDILKTHELLPSIITVDKCDEMSEERRKYGNQVFAQKKDYAALKQYNKSIAYANSNEILALAYGNRSAVLFENKLYRECLKDIENALSLNYPEKLRQKLLDRKEKTQINLETNSENNEVYYTKVPEISGEQNQIFECACDKIEMKNSENMGRHIVAIKKIEPGDIIAVENPYSKILLYDFYLTHCHNCLERSYNLIPCQKCPLALFCSETCREFSWKHYHKYECSLLDTLHSIDATKLQLLALRVVICARNELENIRKWEDEKVELKIYKSDCYKEIHNLVTNEELRPANDIFARCTVASILLHLLQTANFFSEFEETDVEEMKKCTANLLLRHLQTAPSNMHEISELQGNAEMGYEDLEIGAGAYAFMSLLNHSCSPNVVRHCHGSTMILRALRPLEIGQQLFDNYGYHHALMARDERRTHLKEQYWFTCECEACFEDRPLFSSYPMEHAALVPESELSALTAANREIAATVMPQVIEKIQEFEQAEPKRYGAILVSQEILKQCFAVFGNKRTVF